MDKVLANPRPQLSQFAPRMITLKIDPEKIGKVIGPGGKTINSLSQRFNVTIDVEDDGSIFVSGLDAAAAEAARAEIELITEEVKIGRVYTGKVVGIKDFGVFVELAPGKDGLCHVSELDEKFVKNVTDVVKLGDVLTVKVVAIDDQGRVKLSRKAVMKEQAEDKS
jgi:polyribonucleotide nucleotidyltransferase